ncbi:hypothetical protein [Sinomonas sp. P10A9]|uniref:Uncharacterized protein n=1 Tax=Sinomonas puerhi TaxID=3238584 RepID=A0AB39L156_9MICC
MSARRRHRWRDANPRPERFPGLGEEPGRQRSTGGSGKPEHRFDGGSFGMGIILGVLALWVVYLVIFFAAGAPYARIGGFAFVPVGIYAAAAVVLTARARSVSLGGGMLLGLGIWLLIGGGACIAGLSRTGGGLL